jgi:RNA polymerase sigma-70 factor (TIGR02957 family)
MTVFDPTVFDGNRNLLFTVAYRLLGSAADAEDSVQDAWVRWSSADRSQVADPKAYLVRIVTNLALDRLRSAQARRETYIGPWLPEPILTAADDSATDSATGIADDVSMAMLMVLENLSPLERAVFVLKEAFGFSYAEIADAVQRTPDSVRQAGHRARGHVQARRPRFRPTRAQHREVTERFFAAASGGDINTLMQLLAPDVTLWTDGGGKVRQAMRPITGAQKVAAWMAGVTKRPYEGIDPAAMTFEVVELNGGIGILISGAGRVIATLSLDLDEHGRIGGILNVANPDKLRAVTAKTVHEI